MKIKINGEKKVIEKEGITITELLAIEKVDMPETVSVEYNSEMLDRDKFDTQKVSDGDEIEFLYFMGGGQHLYAKLGV